MSVSSTTQVSLSPALKPGSPLRASWTSQYVLPGIHSTHGRGFIATADIATGALLFVIVARNQPAKHRESLGLSVVFDQNKLGNSDSIQPNVSAAVNARLDDAGNVIATRLIRSGELIRIDLSRDLESPGTSAAEGESVVSGGISILVQFLKSALQHEWGAAVVSFTSAVPSNLLSCVIVLWGAEWLQERQIFTSEAAYISAVSILTGFVGYATYLIGYYGGMLIKERRDLFDKGDFSWPRFRRKCRVIWYDFVIHLPSDFYSLPLLSAGQGGMYIAGVSQFWSIFWAQAIADALSAIKEPFFWHGAKKLADFTERRAANEDQIQERGDRVAND